MDGIHIVTRNNVCHHHTDVTAALGQCRIKIQLIIVGDKPFRMDIVQVIGCQFTLERCLYPIRVDPRMELHSPFMAFVNHKLHRVPIRRRCLSLHTGQETAPRLQLRSIQGIRFGAHLKYDCIDTCSLQRVELINECLFQLLGRYATELTIHCLYPRSAEFSLRIRALLLDLCPHSCCKEES